MESTGIIYKFNNYIDDWTRLKGNIVGDVAKYKTLTSINFELADGAHATIQITKKGQQIFSTRKILMSDYKD